MSRRGYTLLELILVVLLITLIMGLALTRLDLLVPRYRLRAAAREVGSVLSLARSRAASVGRDVYVRLHLSEGRYEVLAPFEQEAAFTPVPTTTETELAESEPLKEYVYEAIFRRRLPEPVQFVNVIHGTERDQTIESGEATVRISPFGLGDHVIVNLKLEDRSMAIRLNGLTGMLSYYEQEKGPEELLEDRGE